jgi:hypothetical protein
MRVGDRSKLHVRAIETGDELHFAWRVYVPAGFKVRWEYSNGGYSVSHSTIASEFVARVRLREEERGRLYVFSNQAGGRRRLRLGDAQLADLLRDRWDEVRVEQLGSDDVAVIDADEVVTILRLTLSDDLKRESDQKLEKQSAQRFQTALFDVRFGPDQAFKQTGAANVGGQ